MQLNHFQGGLNTRISPNLISQNEGVKYTNIDNSKISLVPLKEDLNTLLTGGNSIIYFNDTWIVSSEVRDYVEFQDKLYYSNGVTRPQKSSDGTTWYGLGIDAPSNKISTIGVSTPGNLTGTYQWCYTYYNSVDGTESGPNEFSPEIVISSGKATFDLVASTDPQVDRIRLYRLGGNLLYMTMVIELANSSVTYEDNISDINVTSISLSTENTGPSPEGLLYLTEFNAMLFGAVGPTLYFTEIAYPNDWGKLNFIELEADITGIGSTVNGLLIFTKSRTYVITGNSTSTLTKYLLSSYQGCTYHKSIQSVRGGCIFTSNDGICIADGTNIEVVSTNKLGKVSYNVIDSAVYDEEYYLVTTTKTIVCDFRHGSISFKELDIIGQTMYYSHLLDSLYYSKDNKIYKVFGDESNRTMVYKTGYLSEGSLTNRKTYNNIYIYSTGDMQVEIFIDGISLGIQDLVSGVNDITTSVSKRYGYYMELEITGSNSVLEIEYKVENKLHR